MYLTYGLCVAKQVVLGRALTGLQGPYKGPDWAILPGSCGALLRRSCESTVCIPITTSTTLCTCAMLFIMLLLVQPCVYLFCLYL